MSRWSKTSIGAIPIGQEVTVTPIQLMGAISAIANDGIYMRPFVVKYIKDAQGQIIFPHNPQILDKVISKVTSRRMKAILKGVVDEGTGTKAAIPGVTVAGKTGTAQKVVGGLIRIRIFMRPLPVLPRLKIPVWPVWWFLMIRIRLIMRRGGGACFF